MLDGRSIGLAVNGLGGVYMITVSYNGDWKNTEKFLNSVSDGAKVYRAILEKYAKQGVDALKTATPKEDGVTAASWGYSITESSTGACIEWTNSNINKGVPIAIILQYGHGTGTGATSKDEII